MKRVPQKQKHETQIPTFNGMSIAIGHISFGLFVPAQSQCGIQFFEDSNPDQEIAAVHFNWCP